MPAGSAQPHQTCAELRSPGSCIARRRDPLDPSKRTPLIKGAGGIMQLRSACLTLAALALLYRRSASMCSAAPDACNM